MAEWFAPKRYGLGAGLPISWQGWATLIIYLAIVFGAGLLLAERSPWAFGSIIFTATAILLIVAAKTTRGGWRWRWGEKE
jgi:hypothetical protein